MIVFPVASSLRTSIIFINVVLRFFIWASNEYGGGEARRGRFVGATGGGGWGKRRLQQVFCCRAGDEPGGSDLEQQKER